MAYFSSLKAFLLQLGATTRSFRECRRLVEIWTCYILLLLSPAAESRSPSSGGFLPGDQRPQVGVTASAGGRQFIYSTVHNQGDIQITMANYGSFGTEELRGIADPLTGEIVRGITYPRGSGIVWGQGLILIGGVIGKDTVVTAGEFLPDDPPNHTFRYETLDIASPLYSPTAHSNLDILCQYNDSISDPAILGVTGHHPLGVRIHQRSMAWSADNVAKFILVTCEITAISAEPIRHCFVGINPIGIVRYPDGQNATRTVVGSLAGTPSVKTCGVPDSLFVGYWMDNDGDPSMQTWTKKSPLGAMGVCILQHPGEHPRTSFNWNVLNDLDNRWWSPYRRADELKYPRNSMNYPTNDKSHYFRLSNGYKPYDQSNMAIDYSYAGWAPPPRHADTAAGGTSNAEFILSSGPFDLGPGQSAFFTYAIVAGDNVHVNPTDYEHLWDPYQPEPYYNALDFTELMTNARWAKWVYDNPGVDTDGDGYFGKFHVCDGDTQWYEGDGVPDFRADAPPPSPKLKVIPSLGKLAIRWNGYYSETAIDPFTKIKDFEGYRVYAGLDDRESSMTLLISWDHQNYNRYFLKQRPNGTWAWETKDLPFLLDSLRTLYGDGFSPMLYTRDNPWHWNDTLFSFTQVDYNMSQFSPTGVHKVYPEARQLGTDTLQWTPDDLTSEHGEPLPKYYEYEYVFNNVLPTIAQYISVTAFDFGFAKGNIPAKESNKLSNRIIAYAQNSADSVETKDLNVYVYPNPYLFHVNYAAQGYENHDNRQIAARSHRLNFGNLPPKCRISIYSLDGDLIRSWEHDYNPSDPQAMHDSWDLITRNTMLPAAGLYYWTVESPTRTQIGKFVIIE